MSFLALTPLQVALLSALTAGTIIALYFLKLRHRRVVVSSSLLWRQVLDERQSHSLWEKLRRIISIVIAVTIASADCAVARPAGNRIADGKKRTDCHRPRHVADDEALTQDGKPAGNMLWSGLKDSLTAAVRRPSSASSDTSGLTASAFTTDRNEIRKLIEQMSPKTGDRSFPKSMPAIRRFTSYQMEWRSAQHARNRYGASRFSKRPTMSESRRSKFARYLRPPRLRGISRECRTSAEAG